MNDIASSKGEMIFVAQQPDIDTFVMPTTTGSVFLINEPDSKQKPNTAANQESRSDLGEQPATFAGYEIGDAKISCNLKTSGTPGVLPPIHILLLSVFGKHTTTANEVKYNSYAREDTPIYLSVVVKKQMETQFITGAWINSTEIKIDKGKIQSIDFGPKFKKAVKVGIASLKNAIDGTSTPVTVIPIKEAEGYKRFDVDSYIVVGSDNNTGAGFKVTAVDTTANTVTIEDGVTTVQPVDAVIKGFTPVISESGKNIVSQFAWLKLNTGAAGDRNVAIITANFKVDNGIKGLDEEMSESEWNATTTWDSRKVTLDVSRYFRVEDTQDTFDIVKGTDIVASLNLGKETGNSIALEFPRMRILETGESGKPEKKNDKKFQAYPLNGDDEVTLVIK